MALEEILRRAIDGHLRYVTSVGRLTAEHLREFVDTIGANVPRTQPSAPSATAYPTSAQTGSAQPGSTQPASTPSANGAPSMVLEAEAGRSAVGVFMVENYLPDAVQAAIVASKVADPSGASFELSFTFDPPAVALRPREQILVRVSTLIPEFLEGGTSYVGYIAVPELRGTSVPIVVRRKTLST